MVATEPRKHGKFPFFKKVSENMEKSKMNAEQKYKSRKSQGIIYRLLQIVNIRAVRWMWPQKA